MMFPFDFGYIPGTKGGDGDPLDIVVIADFGTVTGYIMDCRIIGAILADQTESGGKTIGMIDLLRFPSSQKCFGIFRK